MSGVRKSPLDVATSDTIASADSLGTSETIGTSATSATTARDADAGTSAGSRALARAQTATADALPLPAIGQTIGRFVVVDKLGAGGMGVVFAAWDPHLDRKVAIKLLQGQSVDSEEARVRLLREAQAMARIDHPNVLRVHEAGTFGDQVYIAMEFASGGTLKQWLAAKRRTPREIVAVFVQAARGLHAAHAAGLVHRDFKPDNVLMFDGDRPRVTDFGLVGVVGELPPVRVSDSLLATSLSEDTPLSKDLTRTGALMGTPAYMAPEQFLGGLVGSAADQFALCVAMYTALYGAPPFAGGTFAELSQSVIAGRVSPPARDRHVPARLRRALLRGLATDPQKRYPSLGELIAELERDPRRTRITAAAIAAGALAIGGVAYLALSRHTGPTPCSGGDERAATAWSPSAKQQMAQAFAATHRPDADAVLAHVAPMFDRWRDGWTAAYVGACEDTRVRGVQSEHLLDLRMSCLNRRLDETRATVALLAAGGGDAVDHAIDAARALPSVDPCGDIAALTAEVAPPPANNQAAVAAVRAELDRARAQHKLGRYAQELAIARTALADAKGIQYAPVLVEAELELGTAQDRAADRGAAATLEQAMRDALAQGQTELAIRAAALRVATVADQPSKFPIADEIGALATALATRGAPAEARVELDDALGQLALGKNKSAEAKQHYDAAFALASDQLGSDAADTIIAETGLAQVASEQHHYADAQKLYEQVLATTRRVAGPDHPNVALALGNLMHVLIDQNQFANAKQLGEQALDIRLRALGPDHPDVASSYELLGGFYQETGDDKTATEYFQKALAVAAKAEGSDSIFAAEIEVNLATAQNEIGQYADARANFQRALDIKTAAYGSDDPRTVDVIGDLGMIEERDEHFDDSLADFRRAYEVISKADPDDPRALDFLGSQVQVLTRMGKLADARGVEDRTMTLMERMYGPDHPRIGILLGNYGFLQMKLADYAGALASFQRAASIFEAKLGKNHPNVGMTLIGQGQALISLHREAEAVPVLSRALEIGAASHWPPQELGETHYYNAMALYAAPATRAKAHAEAKLALGLYAQGKDAADVKAVTNWLAHRGLR